MKQVFYFLFVCFITLIITQAATAQSLTKFSFTPSNWNFTQFVLNGNCRYYNNSGSNGQFLTLTKSRRYDQTFINPSNQASGAIYKDKIILPPDNSFSSYFSFSFHDADIIDTPADGIVFVINSQTNVVGISGAGIGYSCVTKSIGVEFDLFKNTPLDTGYCSGNSAGYPTGPGYDPVGDINNHHVGINVQGSPLSITARDYSFYKNNDPVNYPTSKHYVWIDYDGTTLSVRISPNNTRPDDAFVSSDLNLLNILNRSEIYVGFTSATGYYTNTHQILEWTFYSYYAPFGLTTSPLSSSALTTGGVTSQEMTTSKFTSSELTTLSEITSQEIISSKYTTSRITTQGNSMSTSDIATSLAITTNSQPIDQIDVAPPTTDSTNKGLTSGGIAAIIIALIAFLCIILAMIIIIFARRSKKKSEEISMQEIEIK